MLPTPEAASPLPLKGAPLADRRSRIRGGRLGAPGVPGGVGMGERAVDDLRHTGFEDALALVVGASFVALGVLLYARAGLLTGGTAGLAFVVHYAMHWPFGAVFFVLNLPFYALAWRRMGRAFTLKTFAAVALVSALSALLPQWLQVVAVERWFAAVFGGFAMGTGFIVLFRHRASLGGVGIVALALQEGRGWRAGHVQLAVDLVVLALSAFVVSPWALVASVVGAVTLNLVIAINHRPGRYTGL